MGTSQCAPSQPATHWSRATVPGPDARSLSFVFFGDLGEAARNHHGASTP